MVEEAALAEHQEIAEAADTVAEHLDLVVHVIRRTGEAGTALEQLLDRRGPLVDRGGVAVPNKAAALSAGFEHLDIVGAGVVARRVCECLGHDHRSPNIVGREIGAAQPLLARGPNADHRSIGEAVAPGGPTELLRALATGVEHWAGG